MQGGEARRVSWEVKPRRESARHTAQRFDRCGERAPPGGKGPVVFLPPATALRRRLAEPGGDEPLVLQAEQRGIDGAERYRTPGPSFDLVPDRDPIRLGLKSHEGQENELFEFAESVSHLFLRRCR